MYCPICGHDLIRVCATCGYLLPANAKPLASKMVAATLRRKWRARDVHRPGGKETTNPYRLRRFKEMYDILTKKEDY